MPFQPPTAPAPGTGTRPGFFPYMLVDIFFFFFEGYVNNAESDRRRRNTHSSPALKAAHPRSPFPGPPRSFPRGPAGERGGTASGVTSAAAAVAEAAAAAPLPVARWGRAGPGPWSSAPAATAPAAPEAPEEPQDPGTGGGGASAGGGRDAFAAPRRRGGRGALGAAVRAGTGRGGHSRSALTERGATEGVVPLHPYRGDSLIVPGTSQGPPSPVRPCLGRFQGDLCQGVPTLTRESVLTSNPNLLCQFEAIPSGPVTTWSYK